MQISVKNMWNISHDFFQPLPFFVYIQSYLIFLKIFWHKGIFCFLFFKYLLTLLRDDSKPTIVTKVLEDATGYRKRIWPSQPWPLDTGLTLTALMIWMQLFKVAPCWLVQCSAVTLWSSFYQTAHNSKFWAEKIISVRPV